MDIRCSIHYFASRDAAMLHCHFFFFKCCLLSILSNTRCQRQSGDRSVWKSHKKPAESSPLLKITLRSPHFFSPAATVLAKQCAPLPPLRMTVRRNMKQASCFSPQPSWPPPPRCNVQVRKTRGLLSIIRKGKDYLMHIRSRSGRGW